MLLEIGNVVIHPHHGPATVAGFTTRTLRKNVVDYAELTIQGTGLTVAIPVAKAEEIGIRDVACESQLERLAKVLCAPTQGEEETWSRRVKANVAKLQSGNPLMIAEVVRDTIRRREERGVSMAEKEILRDALKPLVAEVAIAVDVDPERAEEVITELVTTGDIAVIDRVGAAA